MSTASSKSTRFLFISNIIYIYTLRKYNIWYVGRRWPTGRPILECRFTYLTAGQVSRAVWIIVYDDCGRERGIISSFARETRLLSHKLLSATVIIYSQLRFTVSRRRAPEKGWIGKLSRSVRSYVSNMFHRTPNYRLKTETTTIFTLLKHPTNGLCTKFGSGSCPSETPLLAKFSGLILFTFKEFERWYSEIFFV